MRLERPDDAAPIEVIVPRRDPDEAPTAASRALGSSSSQVTDPIGSVEPRELRMRRLEQLGADLPDRGRGARWIRSDVAARRRSGPPSATASPRGSRSSRPGRVGRRSCRRRWCCQSRATAPRASSPSGSERPLGTSPLREEVARCSGRATRTENSFARVAERYAGAARAVKRALITGITGQDGSYLAELLLEKGYEVHGLVHGSLDRRFERLEPILGPDLTLHAGDLLDEHSLVSGAAVRPPRTRSTTWPRCPRSPSPGSSRSPPPSTPRSG